MNAAFSFQVNSKGVVINFSPEAEIESIKKELAQHVQQASDFFAGVDIYLDISNRSFTMKKLKEITEIIENYNEVCDIYIYSEEESEKVDFPKKRETILIKRTIRSGQRIKYPANIVIIGDVNPGSEIIASGDIIVMGKLRGVVHAGAGGYKDAEVIALLLDPTQLRIADLISRPPEQEDEVQSILPEKAFIKENNIIVEELSI